MAAAASVVASAAAVASTAGGTANSFAQAGKQRKLQAMAEADAAKALEAARKRTEINFYEQLAINKEPYALEREAMLTQGAQAIEAGRESERGVASTVGRVMAQQNLAQQGITTAMSQEMSNLEKLQAQEESRLRDVNIQLDLGEVTGAQQAARDAQMAQNQAQKEAFAGIANTVKVGAEQLVPLFAKQAVTPPYTGTPLMMQSAQNAPAQPFNVSNILSPYMPNTLPPYSVQAPFLPSTQPSIPLMMQQAANPTYSFNPNP